MGDGLWKSGGMRVIKYRAISFVGSDPQMDDLGVNGKILINESTHNDSVLFWITAVILWHEIDAKTELSSSAFHL